MKIFLAGENMKKCIIPAVHGEIENLFGGGGEQKIHPGDAVSESRYEIISRRRRTVEGARAI